jgi:hypothetical protein
LRSGKGSFALTFQGKKGHFINWKVLPEQAANELATAGRAVKVHFSNNMGKFEGSNRKITSQRKTLHLVNYLC